MNVRIGGFLGRSGVVWGGGWTGRGCRKFGLNFSRGKDLPSFKFIENR